MSTYYIETFGCQMNKYDSELVATILDKHGYQPARSIDESDLILINTCSVRDHAEQRVKNKIDDLYRFKKRKKGLVVGILGCMAQRMGQSLIDEKPLVDFVLGPDSYRNLPELLVQLNNGGIDKTEFENPYDDDETYADIYPTRFGEINAWVAIMRGCNNFCSYCIVPYLRGRERSRSAQNIIHEVKELVTDGYQEVTLLGQNVNSYHDGKTDFADLIRRVADVDGVKRVRFATSHPKDMSLKLIKAIGEHPNICNFIHLPIQSGSNVILKAMNRKYTREHYLELIEHIRTHVPNPALQTDIIVGFPGETDVEFQETVDLFNEVKFDGAFIFKYSPRSGTAAFKLKETVSEAEKTRRLQELNRIQKKITVEKNLKLVGTVQEILVEGRSKKRKKQQWMGRTDSNKIVVFNNTAKIKKGELICVKINEAEGQTLFGELLTSPAEL
ncbi:tRNA (N6-isopentenyl adenosine(37)-C2)-methylthiotransferase MiaB [candidate division KSB1 bacterium]|nr:tRNA (N6-isopentenyl adenosine(37)-C2)-methylthiotransferase MiaB [candidate division KSB1 bacterium]